MKRFVKIKRHWVAADRKTFDAWTGWKMLEWRDDLFLLLHGSAGRERKASSLVRGISRMPGRDERKWL